MVRQALYRLYKRYSDYMILEIVNIHLIKFYQLDFKLYQISISSYALTKIIYDVFMPNVIT